MTDRPRRVWITRTRPGAEATAERLAAMGFEPVVEPLLAVRPIRDASLDLAGVDALAFTSGQAVRAFAALRPERDLAVFAVGEATARLAREAGFASVTSADGDVRALAERIAAARPRPAKVLAPGARETAADLPALLAERGVQAKAVAVYETIETSIAAPPPTVDAVLVHSPRAAKALAALLSRAAAAGLDAFAISDAAAAPLRALPFNALRIAAHPDEASLLALLRG
jgi:uroporphyrinogen-III synthase